MFKTILTGLLDLESPALCWLWHCFFSWPGLILIGIMSKGKRLMHFPEAVRCLLKQLGIGYLAHHQKKLLKRELREPYLISPLLNSSKFLSLALTKPRLELEKF